MLFRTYVGFQRVLTFSFFTDPNYYDEPRNVIDLTNDDKPRDASDVIDLTIDCDLTKEVDFNE
jgi:hypothetical protein